MVYSNRYFTTGLECFNSQLSVTHLPRSSVNIVLPSIISSQQQCTWSSFLLDLPNNLVVRLRKQDSACLAQDHQVGFMTEQRFEIRFPQFLVQCSSYTPLAQYLFKAAFMITSNFYIQHGFSIAVQSYFYISCYRLSTIIP